MSAASKPEGTAVARVKPALPPEVQATIEYNRQKNAVVAAIRGTIWGKEISQDQVRAVAQYAREMHIDPVRHIEVLGGRIYLTADFYAERGAKYIRDGSIVLHETEYIHADERLAAMAKGDGSEEAQAWAERELSHRAMQRIKYAVPEAAKAAAVVRLTMRDGGATFVGVNWCGGTTKRDPVGEAEPTKTAETRAARRAWKRIVAVIPELAESVGHMEARATIVEDEVAQLAGAEVKALPRSTGVVQDDSFTAGDARMPVVQGEDDDPYAESAA